MALHPLIIFRNHLKRSKNNLDLAINVLDTSELRGLPNGLQLENISDYLTKLVDTADKVMKEKDADKH